MQPTQITENVSCHTHEQFQIQIAVTRADFTRTSVTPQSNTTPTIFLLSAPEEVFTSKPKYINKNKKYLHVSLPFLITTNIYLGIKFINGCEEFKHLEVKIDKGDRQENYIKNRINKGRAITAHP